MTTIPAPYPYFTDASGNALEAGKIYIGTAGLDPRTNPIAVYQDEALTIAWAQPIRTVGGYPVYIGAPSNIQTAALEFSLIIATSTGEVVFRDLNVVSIDAANVRFIQAGTGAVARSAQAKMRETLSAADFGALGGAADDTVAIQAAIDALPNTGGVVVLSAIYQVKDLRINGTTRNKQNVVLRGNGWGTGLKMPNGGMTAASRTNLIDGEGAIGCAVEGITLDGNRANQTIPVLVDGPDYEKFNLVYFEGSDDCAVTGCNIINAAVIGVNPGGGWTGDTGSDRARVSNNTFGNCKNSIAAMRLRRATITENTIFGVYANEDYGILIDEYSEGCLISGNDISDMGDVGIFLFRATGCIVSNNRVTDSLVSIALNDASNDNLVIGNECDGSLNSHIKLMNGCLRNKIKNNDLSTAVQYCIVLEAGTGGSSFNEISGNTCRLATFSNIAIFDAAFTQIESNRSSEAVGSGIYIQGACDWSAINDNYCFNNSTGSANDAGIRLVAQNNITVVNNKCFDSQGTKTQNWGIRCNETFTGTVTLTGNDVRQNELAGMAISGGTPIVRGNPGWITEAFGDVALGSAATAVTVTHGMDMTPNYRSVRVTFVDATVRSSKVMYIANVGATTFEIRVDVAPGANTVIAWEAAAYV